MTDMKKQLLIVFLLVPCFSMAQTEETDFQSRVIEKVIFYNNENDKIAEALKKASAEKSADTIRLNAEMKEVVKKCFQAPQDYIAKYPASPYCLHALIMMGTGSKNSPVQIVDLERLYGSLAPQIRNSVEGKAYALNLKSWPWLNQLKNSASTAIIKNGLSVKLARTELAETVGKQATVKELPVSAKPLSEIELASLVKAATLIVNMAYLSAEDQTLQLNPTTAYVIDESGVCVTNYHVMKEYSGKEMYQSFSVMTAEGKAYPVVKILACSESDDLVVFQVDTKGDKLSALPLGNAAPDGAAVHVMSHPVGSFFRFTSGIVARNATVTHSDKQVSIMGITADFNVGSSGGPIVDDCGNVVGTVSRIVDGAKIGVPVSELKKLVEFKK